MTDSVPVTVDTPLGPEKLVFLRMTGREGLGEVFSYDVDLVSDDLSCSLDDLLGQPMAVHFGLDDGSVRHFHGIVSEIELFDHVRPRALYRVRLRPWLSLLAHTTNCRIFQHQSIPDIIKKIFRDRGFTDFEDALSEDYPKAEYIVQYRESDLNFVTRLMEHAGIYYYFRHTADAHTLVLADSSSAHKRTPGCEQLPFRPPDENRKQGGDCIDEWRLYRRITPGAMALRDFDFEKPNADLTAKLSTPKNHARADSEIYEYPGSYIVRRHGETQAKVRLQQRQEPFERAEGHTNARAFTTGALFELGDHPRDDQNCEHLIAFTRISLSGHQLQSGAQDSGSLFSCGFSVIDSRIPFRTQSSARKPVVEGPQTAIVVGQSGEEIWTDKYGRVKVQFHWDRKGGHDENSSCWVRVSQAWAGANWGSIHVPRIGQEVIVDFLEGDPDRPIITGRVYNANNMPPYDLPGNQTQSGIKSRSSKGGGPANANEIRFEDLKGSEEFYVQAEKDMNALVKNNETRTVGADRTTTIDANETLTVKKDRSAHVIGNETIVVDKAENVTISGGQTTTITGDDSTTVSTDQTLTVTGSRTHTVNSTETILVTALQSITAGSQAVTVGSLTKTVATAETATIGTLNETVLGSVTVSVGGSRTETVDKDETVSITGAQAVSIGKTGSISVKKQLVIDAQEELVIKSGDASITLKKNGDIIVKGKDVSHDASGKVSLKASSDMVLKGSKISQN
jgi:type VI secretion system secreted protein VgrG